MLISSWRSSQTEGRGSAEFIISISPSVSLYPSHKHSHNVKTWCIGFICIKITLFCIAIILSSQILTIFFRLDSFQTVIRSPRVVHCPFSINAMFWYVCASVQPDGLWESSRTVWGVTQSAECPSQPTHTVNSPVTGNSWACRELWVSDRVSSTNR